MNKHNIQYLFSLVVVLLLMWQANTQCQEIRIFDNRATNPYKPESTKEEQLVFFYYQLDQENPSNIDLRHFKKMNPYLAENLQDSIKIDPPKTDLASDWVYAVGYVESEIKEEGVIVVMLVSEYNSANPQYFIDKNLDQNYLNDGLPFSFKASKESKKINLTHFLDKSAYNFWLLNPNQNTELIWKNVKMESDGTRENNNQKRKVKGNKPFMPISKRRPHLIAKAGLFFGTGRTTYNYIDQLDGYEYSLDVNTGPKGLSTGLELQWYNVVLGAKLNLQSVYYWTPERRVVYGEPYTEIIVENGIRRTQHFDNYDKITNKDQFSNQMYTYELQLGYAIQFRMLELVPYIGLGQYSFEDNYYLPNRYIEEDKYVLENRNFISFGATLNAKVGQNSMIYVSCDQYLMNFEPNSLFNTAIPETLTNEQNQLLLGVGYAHRFSFK